MKTCWSILIFLFVCTGYGQESNSYNDSLYQVIQSDAHDTSKITAYNDLGVKVRRLGFLDSAQFLAQTAIDISEPLTSSSNERISAIALKGVALGYNNLGSIQSKWGNYDKALEFYLFSLQVKEVMDDSLGMAGAYNNIGTIYNAVGKKDEALKYYDKAVKINRPLGNKKWLSYNYNNMGSVYFDQGIIDKAEMCYDSSLILKMELGDSVGMAMSYNNISAIFESREEYDTSMYMLLHAIELQKNAGDVFGEALTTINIGRVYYRKKQYAEAQGYLDMALEQSLELNHKDFVHITYKLKSELDSAKGDYNGAFANYKLFITYKDSMMNEEMLEKSVQAEMQYEFDKKEYTSKIEQEKKNGIYEAELQRRKLQRNFFIIGFGIMLLLGVFIYRGYIQKRKSNELLSTQKTIIEQKQNEILDSINYAKRIQNALLPSMKLMKEHLPNHFVLYKPKDIVAGDFYWMEQKDNKICLAVADCTGHGVPGAMVSVICVNGLNRSVREFNLTKPSDILNKTRSLVVNEFEKSDETVRDGMDIALVSFDEKPKSSDKKNTVFDLQYAGAHNGLWIIRKGAKEIEEIKADKQPIGQYDKVTSYTNHEIELQKGDTLYLFTDGYSDQFGGDKGKKYRPAKLKELLLDSCHHNMTEQKEILDRSFTEWMGPLEQLDDVCVIGFRI
jgi:serine phosphatase RsbU (regulator of sigma subunit)/predicted negative regulator of RcsB-dependent stress response